MGKVYIFTNDAMPGIIKIGITEGSVEDRIKTLDNTSVPLPFRFHYAIESDRFKEIEAFIHNAFGAFRLRENREFFKLDPERAVSALKISGCAEIKIGNEMIDEKGEIIKEDETIEKKYKKRFSFAVVNVPIGSILNFTRDENKKCTVVSDNEVEYENERYSLSRLADKFLKELGYDWKSVQGPAYFEYDGKTLYEIKRELESEDDDE
ncbi:MAG: GIY-YIG nuclease family protein [Spirochaetota bacterium]|nr:GIY-YIG nuclease family protein [Spirochaetota bacterium]